jgi:hypothetical protein
MRMVMPLSRFGVIDQHWKRCLKVWWRCSIACHFQWLNHVSKKVRNFVFTLVLSAVIVPLFRYYVDIDLDFKNYVGIGLAVAIAAIFRWAIHRGAMADNRIFLDRIRRNPTVRISHRLSEDNLAAKLQVGALIPYPAKSSRLFKWLAELQDGKAPATWISIGEPQEVRSIFLGSFFQKDWTRAISFEVPSTDVVMPPIFLKHLYGCSQQRLLKCIEIPHDADLYRRTGSRWSKLTTAEREQLILPIAPVSSLSDASQRKQPEPA